MYKYKQLHSSQALMKELRKDTDRQERERTPGVKGPEAVMSKSINLRFSLFFYDLFCLFLHSFWLLSVLKPS